MTTREELFGRWVHAHEEGRAELVLRPADKPMPPSRGRRSFDFHPDGTFTEGGPGPTDRPQTTTGRWSVDGDTLILQYGDDRPNQAFRVTCDAERLVLAPTRNDKM